MEFLQEKWNLLFHTTIDNSIHSSYLKHQWFDRLVQYYSEPQRYYHTLNHVKELLELSDTYQQTSAVVLYSIWFHEYLTYMINTKINDFHIT